MADSGCPRSLNLRWTVPPDCPNFPSMSKAAKGASPETGPADETPFEQAIEKLEAIVESMESGELTLEETLARFEEGTRLAKVCQVKLSDAELKVSQLEKNSTGEFVLKTTSRVE